MSAEWSVPRFKEILVSMKMGAGRGRTFFLVMPHGTKGLGRLLFHSILGGETSKCTERVAVCVKGGLGRKLEEWPLRLHIGRW